MLEPTNRLVSEAGNVAKLLIVPPPPPPPPFTLPSWSLAAGSGVRWCQGSLQRQPAAPSCSGMRWRLPACPRCTP